MSVQEKYMVTKRGGESTADICKLAFRKRVKPVTEASFEPERELAIEMVERGVRVQDLIKLLGQQGVIVSEPIGGLLNWWLSKDRCVDCDTAYFKTRANHLRCSSCRDTANNESNKRRYYESKEA